MILLRFFKVISNALCKVIWITAFIQFYDAVYMFENTKFIGKRIRLINLTDFRFAVLAVLAVSVALSMWKKEKHEKKRKFIIIFKYHLSLYFIPIWFSRYFLTWQNIKKGFSCFKTSRNNKRNPKDFFLKSLLMFKILSSFSFSVILLSSQLKNIKM